MPANPLAFLVSSSSRERHALAASTLGWMLDGMDVTLYAMVLRELLRELQLSTAQAGLLASVTLDCLGRGRHSVRLHCGPLRPPRRADRKHRRLLGIHRRLRILPRLVATGGTAPGSGIGHGRRMGYRRGARLRNVAR